MFEDFKKAGQLLFARGINDTHSGNISARDGDKIIITSRMALTCDLKQQDIVECPGGESAPLASRDLAIHKAIYDNTKAAAIIHAHCPSALALCVTENKILPQDAKGQAFFPSGITILKPRVLSDRDEITKLILPMMNSVPCAVMVKGYGSFVCALSVMEALEMTTALELSSKIWLDSKLVGARQAQPAQHQQQHHSSYDKQKRSALPPAIGVMGRRTGVFSRRDMKR